MKTEEIIELFNKRRQKLVQIFGTRGMLKLSKQHQVYGALNELDLVLDTLKFSLNVKQPNSWKEKALEELGYNRKNGEKKNSIKERLLNYLEKF